MWTISYWDTGSKFDGECGDLSCEIDLDSKLSGEKRLDAEIHEALHACLPDLCEDAVMQTAEGVTGLLWKIGYRLKK